MDQAIAEVDETLLEDSSGASSESLTSSDSEPDMDMDVVSPPAVTTQPSSTAVKAEPQPSGSRAGAPTTSAGATTATASTRGVASPRTKPASSQRGGGGKTSEASQRGGGGGGGGAPSWSQLSAFLQVSSKSLEPAVLASSRRCVEESHQELLAMLPDELAEKVGGSCLGFGCWVQ